MTAHDTSLALAVERHDADLASRCDRCGEHDDDLNRDSLCRPCADAIDLAERDHAAHVTATALVRIDGLPGVWRVASAAAERGTWWLLPHDEASWTHRDGIRGECHHGQVMAAARHLTVLATTQTTETRS